jgi:hypothetical protein
MIAYRKGKNLQNIERQEQSIAIFENKNDKIIQLKDAITSFLEANILLSYHLRIY